MQMECHCTSRVTNRCRVNASRPMLVALYVGTGKPNSADDYLLDLVTEIEELQSYGFTPCDESVAKLVVVRSFVCDAPARAFRFRWTTAQI